MSHLSCGWPKSKNIEKGQVVFLFMLMMYRQLITSVSIVGGVTAIMAQSVESFQLQMGFSFPFLRANDLRSSLLIMRARSFLLSCK